MNLTEKLQATGLMADFESLLDEYTTKPEARTRLRDEILWTSFTSPKVMQTIGQLQAAGGVKQFTYKAIIAFGEKVTKAAANLAPTPPPTKSATPASVKDTEKGPKAEQATNKEKTMAAPKKTAKKPAAKKEAAPVKAPKAAKPKKEKPDSGEEGDEKPGRKPRAVDMEAPRGPGDLIIRERCEAGTYPCPVDEWWRPGTVKHTAHNLLLEATVSGGMTEEELGKAIEKAGKEQKLRGHQSKWVPVILRIFSSQDYLRLGWLAKTDGQKWIMKKVPSNAVFDEHGWPTKK